MGEELGIIAAELRTGAVVPQPFYVTAHPARSRGQWWLLATSLPEALRAAVRKPDQPALASGYEFMLMVKSAARQMGERLDLMRVNAAILGDEVAASPEARADLQAEFDQIVLNDAYDGIVSRTGAGEYLLLRDREAPADSLLARLGAAAESRAIPQSQLGLESNALQRSTLGPNLGPAAIRHAAASLRQPGG